MKTKTIRLTPKAADLLSGLSAVQREQAVEVGSKLVTDDHFAWFYFKKQIHNFLRAGMSTEELLEAVTSQIELHAARLEEENIKKSKGGAL